jgi:hypothetical protein
MVGGEVVMCSKLKLDDDEGFGYGGGDYIGGCGGGVLRAAGWAVFRPQTPHEHCIQ